jgi:hypothetical protein
LSISGGAKSGFKGSEKSVSSNKGSYPDEPVTPCYLVILTLYIWKYINKKATIIIIAN